MLPALIQCNFQFQSYAVWYLIIPFLMFDVAFDVRTMFRCWFSWDGLLIRIVEDVGVTPLVVAQYFGVAELWANCQPTTVNWFFVVLSFVLNSFLSREFTIAYQLCCCIVAVLTKIINFKISVCWSTINTSFQSIHIKLIDSKNWYDLTKSFLENHYDPSYSSNTIKNDRKVIKKITAISLDNLDIQRIAKNILSKR